MAKIPHLALLSSVCKTGSHAHVLGVGGCADDLAGTVLAYATVIPEVVACFLLLQQPCSTAGTLLATATPVPHTGIVLACPTMPHLGILPAIATTMPNTPYKSTVSKMPHIICAPKFRHDQYPSPYPSPYSSKQRSGSIYTQEGEPGPTKPTQGIAAHRASTII